jgi:predicted AlkP superfamily phosphohydrolase/phosphomutase/tetratricopeptide (TPR) repeat protein
MKHEMTVKKTGKKVLLVGWDAADWKYINPLLDAGKMPVFESLVNTGVIGKISTLRPIYSPMIWTSIATGKLPDKHGVLGFIEPDPVTGGARAAASTTRKGKALWNILHQAGLRSGVVGWFVTHPAEPINGVMVSPMYKGAPLILNKPWPLPEQTVHPEHLGPALADLRVHPRDIEAAAILPFVPRAAEVDQKKDRRLTQLGRLLAECCSVHNAATWIMENQEWDFMAVYYDSIDHFGHTFAQYHPPKQDHIADADFEIYKDVMDGIYRFQDMMLGRLLALAGPETTVIVVSDHGFASGVHRPAPGPMKHPAQMANWHRPHGVLCMQGAGIRQDEVIHGASVLDLAPTILTMMGLPVGEDMDGRVLLEAFKRKPRVKKIGSWDEEEGECGMHPADMRMDPETAHALIQQFIALGYVAPASDANAMAEFALEDCKFNLATVYLSTRRPAEALVLLEELVAKKPKDTRFATALAQCRIRLGDAEGARAALGPVMESEQNRAVGEWLLSLTQLQRSKPEEALQHLLRMQEANPGVPAVYVRTGAGMLACRKWDAAENNFRKALELDEDHVAAHLGMAAALLRQLRFQEAAESALNAVVLEHGVALGHHLMGVALIHLGQIASAVIALETAVSLAPELAIAHRWLVRLYSGRGGDLGKAALHRSNLHLIWERRKRQPRAISK